MIPKLVGEKKPEPAAVPVPVSTPSMTADDEDKILARHGVMPAASAPAASPTATPAKKMTENEEDEVLAKYGVKPD